jgi:hypothetical protein
MQARKTFWFFLQCVSLGTSGYRILINKTRQEETVKMKKILVLLTMMVMVFGITAAAYSADVCSNCKGTIRDIPCVTATQNVPGTCGGFDYDLNAVGDGYCLFSAANNYRLIYAICNCAESAKFIPGLAVAVKMTILVNGMDGERGAYWSNLAPLIQPATIDFSDYTTTTAACAGTKPFANTFGAPSYFLSDGATPGVPLATVACTVPAGNRTTILKTGLPGYTLLVGDGNYWWIDVPPIRIDPAVVPAGAKISVRVELFDPTKAPGICPTCVECLCECTIDVAITCCSVAPATTTLSFPYFTDLTNASGWWNGIAITNPSAAAGSCILTANEKNGNVATATVDVPAGGLYVELLENITWAGATGGLPAFIAAACNYGGATGFAMMSDYGGSSMGYKLP